MNIRFNSFLNNSALSENFFQNSWGQLKGHYVRTINFVHTSLQKEAVVIPILITSTALSYELISRVNAYIFNELTNNDGLLENWHENTDNEIKDRYYIATNVLCVTLLNLALYKSVKLGISPMVYTALTMTTLACSAFAYLGTKSYERYFY